MGTRYPLRLVSFAIALLVLALPATAAADPIIDPLAPLFPKYQGAPAVPHQLKPTRAPQNPFMARNPRSNIHNDTWMTDAYAWAGPIGRSPVATSSSMPPALCGSLTFHTRGYIVSVCPSILAAPQARVIDPNTLEILASYNMPNAPDPPGTKAYQNFAGGATSSSTGATASGAPRRRTTCSSSRSRMTAPASHRCATTT
jgi:hypothetical protein